MMTTESSALALRKQELRHHYLALRQAMSSAELLSKSAALSQSLLGWFKQRNFVSQVFLFHGFRGEPRLDRLVLYLSGRLPLALPVCGDNGTMNFYSWEIEDMLVRNRWGIAEPRISGRTPLCPDKQTIMLVPCLSADAQGNRLGYGAGYYDRYLRRWEDKIFTLGILWPEHLHSSQLPAESFDLRLDELI